MPAAACRAGRLRRVLEHRQPELGEVVHRGDVAEQVDGDDRARPRRQNALDGLPGHARRGGIDIAEDRHSAGVYRGLGSRVEGERRQHHLVAGLHPERPERDRQRVGPVRDPDAVPHAQVRRELLLERRDLRPEDVAARAGDGLEPLRERVVMGLQRACEQGNRHERATVAAAR